MNYVIVVILGIIAGFFSASLGLGAGPILVPGLLIMSIVQGYKFAIGTTILTIIPPLSVFACLNYYRMGYINVKLAIVLMFSVIFGTIFGSQFTIVFPPKIIAYMCSGVLAVLSVFWFYCAQTGFYIEKKNSKGLMF
jgi:uncharacterized protein|tara:strand:+ start:144 stop:554 length:411 start_codon:yes stop_codon:yes gene_type:complete